MIVFAQFCCGLGFVLQNRVALGVQLSLELPTQAGGLLVCCNEDKFDSLCNLVVVDR